MISNVSGGFADPVSDAQACFRAVLDSMARPGQTHMIAGVSAPSPLCDAAAALLLTLADHETPVWLDPKAQSAQGWIAFHTGAPLVGPAQAAFAMVLSLPDLTALPNGSDEMPETAATVILQVTSLDTGRRFALDGPGLREPRVIPVKGLPDDFAAVWQRNHGLFPRGIDLILCAGNQIAALPRSVIVKDA